jgi:hypothetical protein
MPSIIQRRLLGHGRRRPLHTSATTWADLVVTRGGARPTNRSILAYSDWFYGIQNDGFSFSGGSPDIVFSNAFCPDNLIASLTPQVDAAALAWTNRNFVLSDLTVDGLKGNGTTKSIGTPYSPPTYWADNSASLWAMATAVTAENTFDIGMGGNNINSQFGLMTNFADTHSYFECWRFDGNNLVTGTAAASPITGFFIGCRTSSSVITMYHANTAHAFAQIGTLSGAQNGAANMGGGYTLEILAINALGTISNWSTKRLSVVGGGIGFTSARSQLLYNRYQTLRAALGGGTV